MGTWFQLPIPLKSVKSHRVSLYYSPSSSQTKEASFVFTVGHGSKQSSTETPKILYPQHSVDEDCRQEYREEVKSGKWDHQEELKQQEQHEEKFKQLQFKHFQS